MHDCLKPMQDSPYLSVLGQELPTLVLGLVGLKTLRVPLHLLCELGEAVEVQVQLLVTRCGAMIDLKANSELASQYVLKWPTCLRRLCLSKVTQVWSTLPRPERFSGRWLVWPCPSRSRSIRAVCPDVPVPVAAVARLGSLPRNGGTPAACLQHVKLYMPCSVALHLGNITMAHET